jgi:hypothetical protein
MQAYCEIDCYITQSGGLKTTHRFEMRKQQAIANGFSIMATDSFSITGCLRAAGCRYFLL